jgi:GTP cyclohydrolase IIa
VKVLSLELVGYREWTESLGHDREWRIQSFQHRLAHVLYETFSEVNAFPVPLRYDTYAVLADGIKEANLFEALKKVRPFSPTEIRVCKGFARRPVDALFSCVDRLDDFPDERVVVAHYDIDGVTKLDGREALEEITTLRMTLERRAREIGAIPQYFGGDNFGVFATLRDLDELIELVKELRNVKVGIGVGKNPREALTKAAEALDYLRRSRVSRWKVLD